MKKLILIFLLLSSAIPFVSAQVDISADWITHPTTGNLLNGEPVVCRVTNRGSVPIDSVLFLGNLQPMQPVLMPGMSTELCFGIMNFSAAGQYDLTCWISAPQDVDPSNDTIRQTVYNLSCSPALPYYWTGSYYPSCWAMNEEYCCRAEINTQAGMNGTSCVHIRGRDIDNSWIPGTGYTCTEAMAFSFIEHVSTLGMGHPNSNISYTFLEFDLRQTYSEGPKYCWFRVKINNVVVADTLGNYSLNPATPNLDPWQHHVYDLSSYSNQPIDIVIETATVFDDQNSITGIGDNVYIQHLLLNSSNTTGNVKISRLNAPVSGVLPPGPQPISVRLVRTADTLDDNLYANCSIDGVAVSSVSGFLWSATANDTLDLQFPVPFTFPASGSYHLKVEVQNPGDSYLPDNYLDTFLVFVTPSPIIPFSEDFNDSTLDNFALKSALNSRVTLAPLCGVNASQALSLSGGFQSGWPSNTAWTTTAAQAWSYKDHLASAEIMLQPPPLNQLFMKLKLRQTYSEGPKYSWFKVLVNDSIQISDISGVLDFNPLTADLDSFQTHYFNLSDYLNTVFSIKLQSSCNFRQEYPWDFSTGDAAYVDDLEFYDPTVTSIPRVQSIRILAGPNPADEFIDISVNRHGEIQSVILCDVLGNIVWPRHLNVGAEKISLSVSDLKSGLYCLQVKLLDTIENLKVVVSH